MRTIATTVLMLALCAPASATHAQCKDGAQSLMSITTDKQFAEFAATMTAGDELNLSTQLAQCQDDALLTPKQLDILNRMVYKLDADVIRRMFGFIERHHLTDSFNDEEARRKR